MLMVVVVEEWLEWLTRELVVEEGMEGMRREWNRGGKGWEQDVGG